MIIYGAGMSGLLAANMLKRHNPVLHEAAAILPNNHGALLRFRTNAVERATGIKLKKVFVQKAVLSHPDGTLTSSPSIQMQNMYSLKVTGGVKSRSIMNLEAGERYIAPDDFLEKLAQDVNIQYNTTLFDLKHVFSKEPILSTIPMDRLMKIAGWSDFPKFEYKEIVSLSAEIGRPDIDIYQTIYYPHHEIPAYRASITGNKLIIEFIDDDLQFDKATDAELKISCKSYLMHFLGSNASGRSVLQDVKFKKQKYGKLLPIDNHQRKSFILAMTDLHNLYSVGRFATWRQILMDDVVKDIGIVSEMIEERTGYARKLKYSA